MRSKISVLSLVALVLAATGCSTTSTAAEGTAASVRSLGPSAKSPDGSWEEHEEAGFAALEAGRYDDAVAHLSEALRLLGELEDADSLAVASVHSLLGTAYIEQRRLPEAEHHFRQALAIEERVLGPDHVDVIETLEALAIVLDYQGHFAEAEQRFRSVIGRLEKTRGAGHGDVARAKANLAVNLGYQGRNEEAERLYREVLPVLQRDGRHLEASHAHNGIGGICREREDLECARQHFEAALRIREDILGPDHPDVATVLFNLTGVEMNEGRLEEAEAHITRCVAICERALPPDHPWRIESLRRYAQVLRARGKHEAAFAIEAQLPPDEEAASAP